MFKSFRIIFFFLISFGSFLIVFNTSKILNQNTSNQFSIMNINTQKLFNKNLNNHHFSAIDSSIINNLYSQKKIDFDEGENTSNLNQRTIIKIKTKPINPSIIEAKLALKNEKKYNLNLFEKYQLDNISFEKKEFIETILPLISYQNQKILIERKKILNLKDSLKDRKTLKNDDIKYIFKLAKKYKIDIKNRHKVDVINDLLVSLDVIPNSIVLAQAANESGWGTSRFAKEFNAFFGEYTYDFSEGVMPLKREEGKKHLIKAFSSFDQSVESYFYNINTHYAYENFRLLRKLMRDKNNFSNINLLVGSLETYAEDDKYVETISSIIKSNRLKEFDIFIYATSQS